MSDARLSMKPKKRAKFDAMARQMVQGSIIEDAVTRFVSQVIAECASAHAAEMAQLREALHAAILSPLGVVPPIAEKFYDPRRAAAMDALLTAPADD